MDINDLTIGQAKELSGLFNLNSNNHESPFKVGKAYMFRTVTHIHVGIVEEVHGDLVSTSSGSWVADTGLFTEFLETGKVSEVEMFSGRSGVNIGALVDWAEWENELYRKRK